MTSMNLPCVSNANLVVTVSWNSSANEFLRPIEDVLCHIKAVVHFECSFCLEENSSIEELAEHVKQLHILSDQTDVGENIKDSNSTLGPQGEEISKEGPESNPVNVDEELNESATSNYLKESKLKKAVTCVLCNMQFKTPAECIEHYGSEHGRFLDDKIEKALKKQGKTHSLSAKDSSNHPRTRNEKNALKCPICFKYYLATNLDFHISSVHFYNQEVKNQKNKQPCLCPLCGKHFKFMSSLISHNRTFHESDKKHTNRKKAENTEYLCEKCSFTTTSSRRLKDHIKAKHENSLNYSCKHCDYKTWELSTIRDHVYKHQDTKRYSCNYCDYQCTQKKQLHRHLVKHGINLPKIGLCKRKAPADTEVTLEPSNDTHDTDDLLEQSTARSEHYSINNLIAKEHYSVNRNDTVVTNQLISNEDSSFINKVGQSASDGSNEIDWALPSESSLSLPEAETMEYQSTDCILTICTDNIQSILPLNSMY